MKAARLMLTFPEHLVHQPIVARMVREFDVMPNIRRAKVEETMGWIVCELAGADADVDRAIDWLVNLGVQVDRVTDALEG